MRIEGWFDGILLIAQTTIPIAIGTTNTTPKTRSKPIPQIDQTITRLPGPFVNVVVGTGPVGLVADVIDDGCCNQMMKMVLQSPFENKVGWQVNAGVEGGSGAFIGMPGRNDKTL